MPGADGVDETDKKDASCVDFVGVNYYTRWMCTSGEKDRVPMPGAPTTAMGWEDYPYGLYRALQMANAYTGLPDGRHVPIIITENGIDDPTGNARASYLVRHLQEVQHALQDGIEVRGYIHWTLVDNFEWAEGYRPRFGLYKVDRSPGGKLKREATPAVNVFRDIARANALEPEVVSQYGMAMAADLGENPGGGTGREDAGWMRTPMSRAGPTTRPCARTPSARPWTRPPGAGRTRRRWSRSTRASAGPMPS